MIVLHSNTIVLRKYVHVCAYFKDPFFHRLYS